jgi:hypothetical protein
MFKRIFLASLLLVSATFADAQQTDFESDYSDGLTISEWLTSGARDDNITPGRVTQLTSAFTTTASSSTVTVSHTSHGQITGAKVIFANVSGTVGGLDMTGAWTIPVLNGNSYTFTHTSTASSGAGPAGTTDVGYPTAGDDAKFRFLCEPSHVAYEDPIVYPGQAMASHLHMFFGNTLTDKDSTYESLRTTGSGSCQGGPLNRTGYWHPAMIQTNTTPKKVIWPFTYQFYYVNSRADLYANGVDGYTSAACPDADLACPMIPVQDIVRGMTAIHGFKLSTGAAQNGGTIKWSCTVNGVEGTIYTDYFYDVDNPTSRITSCGTVGQSAYLTYRMEETSPCWDGTDGIAQTNSAGNTDHYSHLANPIQDGFGHLICPATHQYKLPTLTFIASWAVDTTSADGIEDLKHWKLSSDFHNGATWPSGKTMHWDSFWAWNRTLQLFFHKEINGMRTTPRTFPYLYNSVGADSVGGILINTDTGGLGNDCSALGVSGNCKLKTGDLGNGFTINSAIASPTRTDMPTFTGSGLSPRGRAKLRIRLKG